MNVNYQKELEKIIVQAEQCNQTPTLFLHSCCAPCSSYVLEYLSQYFAITVFYYNPNLHPDEEYVKRAKEQQDLISKMSSVHQIKFIEGAFDKAHFYEKIKGYEDCLEGQERCFICYRMRLEETARVAREMGMYYFCTTLTISPLKNAAKLNEIGLQLAEEHGIAWLPSDFKKKEGYKRSVALSEDYGLYRQDYCGCVFSARQRKLTK